MHFAALYMQKLLKRANPNELVHFGDKRNCTKAQKARKTRFPGFYHLECKTLRRAERKRAP